MASVPILTELQEAADNAAKGLRDRETMRKAAERMDALRESIRRRVGTLNIAIELVRELREE